MEADRPARLAESPGAVKPRSVWIASTGRTATLFLAACLDRLEGAVALHEGHTPSDPPRPRLPPINVHNRKAWHDPEYAARLVTEKRSAETLHAVAGRAGLFVDVAFYNASLLSALAERYPDASLFVIFRRCEGFVRSATIVSGEDRQPAGWPDRSKPLTDREKFISLGRLKPEPGDPDHASWDGWSGIQRNIWLWTTVNTHLNRFSGANPNCHRLFFEDLAAQPEAFWAGLLREIGKFSPSTLSACVEFSKSKINRRQSYQIGGAESWNAAEQDLYEDRARALERKIYG